MNNKYNGLVVEKTNDITITSDNKLRNCKKSLGRKKERYVKTLDEEIKKEIEILKIAISEYENRITSISIKNPRSKKNIGYDESTFLNSECKKVKLYRMKCKIKQNKISKLWRKSLYKPPKWEYKTNLVFPDKMIEVIIGLFCYNNRTDTIFSIIPKDILIYLIESNITWIDFPDKEYLKNKVTVYKKDKKKYIGYYSNRLIPRRKGCYPSFHAEPNVPI